MSDNVSQQQQAKEMENKRKRAGMDVGEETSPPKKNRIQDEGNISKIERKINKQSLTNNQETEEQVETVEENVETMEGDGEKEKEDGRMNGMQNTITTIQNNEVNFVTEEEGNREEEDAMEIEKDIDKDGLEEVRNRFKFTKVDLVDILWRVRFENSKIEEITTQTKRGIKQALLCFGEVQLNMILFIAYLEFVSEEMDAIKISNLIQEQTKEHPCTRSWQPRSSRGHGEKRGYMQRGTRQVTQMNTKLSWGSSKEHQDKKQLKKQLTSAGD